MDEITISVRACHITSIASIWLRDRPTVDNMTNGLLRVTYLPKRGETLSIIKICCHLNPVILLQRELRDTEIKLNCKYLHNPISCVEMPWLHELLSDCIWLNPIEWGYCCNILISIESATVWTEIGNQCLSNFEWLIRLWKYLLSNGDWNVLFLNEVDINMSKRFSIHLR